MQNCFVREKDLTIAVQGDLIGLTISPLTFMKLIDVNTALPDGVDLAAVMEDPTPLHLSIVTYCLLNESSKKKIEEIKLEVNGQEEQTNPAHKLFCLMCENNVNDGLNNYHNVLRVVVDQIKDSTVQPETKKKTFLGKILKKILVPIRWTSKKFTTRSAQITTTHI